MILVTGVGGTIGSEVLNQLQAKGAKVRAAIHDAKRRTEAVESGIDAVDMDFTDLKSVDKALQGIEKLFLVTATLPKQAELEAGVARAAQAAGVRHIVKLSVIGAEEEEHIFAQWHHAAEKAIAALPLQLQHTFVRANSFMQNFANFFGATIKAQNAFYTPVPDARISHVDVRDIAAVATAALTSAGHDGKIYTVTGPAALTYRQTAKILSSVAGREIQAVPVSMADNRKGTLAAGIPEFYADALDSLNEYYGRGGGNVISDSVREVTGRAPISFKQFAAEHASDWTSATAKAS